MSHNLRKAMILAAGEGTRLRPLTLETAKVLLPLGGVPLICYTLAWLRSYGIQEITINLYHLGEKIRSFLESGSRFGVRIYYSTEETLLGTAGGVKKVEHLFDNTFVVVYGDVLTDFDLSAMMEFHRQKKATATIAVTQVSNPREKGVVQMNEDGRIISLIEKPAEGTEPGNMANGGIYILERDALDFIPSQGFCDFAYDIFPKILEVGSPLYGYVLTSEDYLIDIGTIDKYFEANEDIKLGKLRIRYGE